MTRIFGAFILALLLGGGTALAQTTVGTASITPNSTAYSAGNCLTGNGLAAALAVPALVPGGTGGGSIISASVADTSGQDAAIDILVFIKKPSGTYTDHGACSIAAADLPYWVGTISFATYKTYGTPGVASLQSVDLSLNNLANGYPAGSSFWIVPVVQGTPTYGSSQTLTLNFGVLADGPSQ